MEAVSSVVAGDFSSGEDSGSTACCWYGFSSAAGGVGQEGRRPRLKGGGEAGAWRRGGYAAG